MKTEKVIRKTKQSMVVTGSIGLVLLLAGIYISVARENIGNLGRGLTGLSFIPLAMAGMYFYKYNRISKDPTSMKSIIIDESDERLSRLRDEAGAKAFRLTKGALFLGYMGYTLLVPEDIFESLGWWILFGCMFLAFVSEGLFLKAGLDRDRESEE